MYIKFLYPTSKIRIETIRHKTRSVHYIGLELREWMPNPSKLTY